MTTNRFSLRKSYPKGCRVKERGKGRESSSECVSKDRKNVSRGRELRL